MTKCFALRQGLMKEKKIFTSCALGTKADTGLVAKALRSMSGWPAPLLSAGNALISKLIGYLYTM